ncbi:flagellar basal body rod protein FlgG [Pseudomonas putida S11]|nr:flagellar basal body rod protein FlgG [Pseudomonas putida S11]
MLPALWVAKTGLSAQDTNLTVISNNLANVSTTGFKRDRAEFQDLLYQIKRQPGAQSTQDSELPSGLQVGTGVRIVGTQKNFQTGSLQTTEKPAGHGGQRPRFLPGIAAGRHRFVYP